MKLFDLDQYFLYKTYKPSESPPKTFLDLSKELNKLLIKTTAGFYLYREKLFIEEIEEVLGKMFVLFKSQKQFFNTQIEIFLNNMHSKVALNIKINNFNFFLIKAFNNYCILF